MQKINFKNLPDTSTPLNAENLNLMQDNIESAIDTVASNIPTVVDSLDGSSTTDAPSVHAVNSLKSKVLWTNSDPNVSFGPQNIILNSDDYDFYEIYYTFSVANNTILQHEKSIKGYSALLNSIGATTGATTRRRLNYVNDTTFQVDDAYYGNNNDISNTYCIPIKIIGHKI